jgi:hypothetical protein
MDDVIDHVRRLLGRTGATPAPPAVHEPTARRVYSDLGLSELFVHAACRGGMTATLIHLEDLPADLCDHLRQHGVRRVTMTASPILRKIRLPDVLAEAGFTGDGGPPDGLVTGCDAAVAETGTVAFAGGLPAGWTSCPTRVAILEPRNFVPDLIDLLSAGDGERVLASGPAVRAYVLH